MTDRISGVGATERSGKFQAGAKAADLVTIDGAAKQFEALMLAYLFRSARETAGEGWLGSGEDQTASLALELAEEQFAEALAAQGGLGIASLIVSGLKSQTESETRTPDQLASKLPCPVLGRILSGFKR
jgi:Rod binding domain-containing protein